MDTAVDWCFQLWVFSQCPIILIPNICPSYLLIEEVRPIFIIYELLVFLFIFISISIFIVANFDYFIILRLLLFNFLLCLLHLMLLLDFLLFLFIKLISTIKISSIWPLTIKVETIISNFNNFLIWSKIFNIICSLGERQLAYLIPIYFYKILLLGYKQFWEISLLPLI